MLQSEVIHCTAEDRRFVLSGYVFVKIFSVSFAVCHLSEHSSVRRSDTLNGKHGAVRIYLGAHGGSAGCIAVNRCDLSVFNKPVQQLIGANEPSLAVGHGNE